MSAKSDGVAQTADIGALQAEIRKGILDVALGHTVDGEAAFESLYRQLDVSNSSQPVDAAARRA